MSFSGKPKKLTTSIPSLSAPSAVLKRWPRANGARRVEDVLAERQLEKELRDIFEDD
jgi:hypothetical protein